MSATLLAQFGAGLAKQLEAKHANTRRDADNLPDVPTVQQGSTGASEAIHTGEARCTITSSLSTQRTQAQAAPSAVEPRSYTIAADGTTTDSDMKAHTMLTRIQSVTGPLRAYDARYCVWGSNGPFDIRDIARRLGTSMHDVIDALPEFKPVRRGKRGDSDDDSEAN